MADISFSCTTCGQSLVIDAEFAGRRVACPGCGAHVTAPTPAEETEPGGLAAPTSTAGPAPLAEVTEPPVHAPPPEETDSSLSPLATRMFEEKMYGMHEEEGPGVAERGRNFLRRVREFDYTLFRPLLGALSPRLLRRRAVRWILGFGLMPLVILHLSERLEWSFEGTAWFLGAFFCFFWIDFFQAVLNPAPAVRRRGMRWAVFTAFIGIPVLLLCQELPLIRDLYKGTESVGWLGRLAGFILGVGVCEELCKAVPLLLFGRKDGLLRDAPTAIYLGIMSGLGFALAEVVNYTMQYWKQSALISARMVGQCIDDSSTWAGINLEEFRTRLGGAMRGMVDHYGDAMMVQVVRFMTLPLIHAAWAGIVGYFLSRAMTPGGMDKSLVVAGIGAMALLHGLYDVFAGGLLSVLFAAGSILALMSYIAHAAATGTRPKDS